MMPRPAAAALHVLTAKETIQVLIELYLWVRWILEALLQFGQKINNYHVFISGGL